MGNACFGIFGKDPDDPVVVVGNDVLGEKEITAILKEMKLATKWSEQRVQTKVPDVLAPLGRLKDEKNARVEAKEILDELRQCSIIKSGEEKTTGGETWTLTVETADEVARPRSRSMSRAAVSRLSMWTGPRSKSISPSSLIDKDEQAGKRRMQSLERMKAKAEKKKRKQEEARRRREEDDFLYRETSRYRMNTKQESAARKREEISQNLQNKVEEIDKHHNLAKKRKDEKEMRHKEKSRENIQDKQEIAEMKKAENDLHQRLKAMKNGVHAELIRKKKDGMEVPRERARQELHEKQEQAAIRRAEREELKARKARVKQERIERALQKKREEKMSAALQPSKKKAVNKDVQAGSVGAKSVSTGKEKSHAPAAMPVVPTPSKDEKLDLDDNFWLSEEEKKQKHQKVMKAKYVSFSVDTKPPEEAPAVKTAWAFGDDDSSSGPKFAWEADDNLDREDDNLPDWLRREEKGVLSSGTKASERLPSPCAVAMTPVVPFNHEDTPCLCIGAMMTTGEEVEQTPVKEMGDYQTLVEDISDRQSKVNEKDDLHIKGENIVAVSPGRMVPEAEPQHKLAEGVPFEVEALHSTKRVPLQKLPTKSQSETTSNGRRKRSFWRSFKKLFKRKQF